MLLKQYYLGCLAHASYLLGDEETHMAVVVLEIRVLRVLGTPVLTCPGAIAAFFGVRR